jgi:hypothetical protein
MRRRAFRAGLIGAMASGVAAASAAASAAMPPEFLPRWRPEAGTLGVAYAGRLGPEANSEPAPSPSAASASPPPRQRAEFGSQGSWQFNAVVGGLSNLGSSSGGQFRIEFEHFLVDRFSLVMDLELSGVSQRNAPSAAVVGAGLLLRWHFLAGCDWTVYADAGCGLAYASSDLPPGTNRIKFSPQLGVGFTLALDEAIRLIGGVRWYHLSNARLGDTNDGFDAGMVYLGLSIGF